MTVRYPPGRSGRLWLMERLAVAERAASVLHRKQQALRQEEGRLRALVERTGAAWEAAVVEAESSQRKAMILGGRPAATAAQVAPAAVHLAWRADLGVEIPAEARCELPPAPALTGTAAIRSAEIGYRRALQAAVEHAAATSALGRVSKERRMTQHRLRVVRDRWIPLLRVALAEVELHLDEHEREELTRTLLHRRRAVPASTASDGAP